jgi:RHS repeat-associated protein
MGVDEPLAVHRNGQTLFCVPDALDSVVQTSDASGLVSKSLIYSSFGKMMRQTGVLESLFGYTAREHDRESSLTYYRARFLDPTKGRFLTEDPVRQWVFSPQRQNPVAYAWNSPQNVKDPSGKNVVVVTVCTVAVFLVIYLIYELSREPVERAECLRALEYRLIQQKERMDPAEFTKAYEILYHARAENIQQWAKDMVVVVGASGALLVFSDQPPGIAFVPATGVEWFKENVLPK